MSASGNAIEAIREQIAYIDIDIETKTSEIQELKKIRRRLANSLEALESL